MVKVQCAESEAQGIEFYCKHLVCIYVMFEWKSKVLRKSKIRVKVIMAEYSRIISISKEITLSFSFHLLTSKNKSRFNDKIFDFINTIGKQASVHLS